MDKQLTAISADKMVNLPNFAAHTELNENTYLINYRHFLSIYISHGAPSEDTLRNYCSAIEFFLLWCRRNSRSPFQLSEYEFTYFRDMLVQAHFKKGSIKSKLNAIRQFYNIAMRLNIIKVNPAAGIGVKAYESKEISPLKFLRLEQLQHLLGIIKTEDEKGILLSALRDKVIIMLMALEGLRTIEIYRMSTIDIDWEMKTIYVHGKGHDDFIYPRRDVLEALKAYLDETKNIIMRSDAYGTPVFISLSNNSRGKRMDRRNIRRNVDKWLDLAGYKKAGMSCHMLRHTCGTLLYSKTKDLQVVKQVLRHSDINITSKYAHVFNRIDNRYTENI